MRRRLIAKKGGEFQWLKQHVQRRGSEMNGDVGEGVRNLVDLEHGMNTGHRKYWGQMPKCLECWG